jgi:hypothetical protein
MSFVNYKVIKRTFGTLAGLEEFVSSKLLKINSL